MFGNTGGKIADRGDVTSLVLGEKGVSFAFSKDLNVNFEFVKS